MLKTYDKKKKKLTFLTRDDQDSFNNNNSDMNAHTHHWCLWVASCSSILFYYIKCIISHCKRAYSFNTIPSHS